MVKRILCLWFPNWPIQRLVVSRPELRRQRVALFRRDARRGRLVSAASPLAMQAGVCVGLPLTEARSLLQRSAPRPENCRRGQADSPASRLVTSEADPWFHVIEHELDADLAAIETLCDELEPFSPLVGPETIPADEFRRGRRPDSILLEVTGLAPLFGGEHALAEQLIRHVAQRGYLAHLAVAPTVGAAWGLARFAAGAYWQQHREPLRVTAADQAVLGQLPVVALRLDASVVETLGQLGIGTIEQLWQLPRNDLARRFGDRIHRRLDQLTGRIEEPVVARRKVQPYVAEQLLEYPLSHRETMEVIIRRLVQQLGAQLQADQQGGLEWTVRLKCQGADPVEFCVSLFRPTATVDHVMPLVAMQLEQALSPVTRRSRRLRRSALRVPATDGTDAGPSSGAATELQTVDDRYTTLAIVEIRVTVSSHVLLAQQQRHLFDESPHLDRQALAHLINRLASRLGTRNVLYPTLQAGAQPEYSYGLRPLVDANRRHSRSLAAARPTSHRRGRPLRLFRESIRLTPGLPAASSLIAAGRNGDAAQPPELLAIAAAEGGRGFHPVQVGTYRVVLSSAPERIETGWWRGRTVCRDYWRIELETGQQWWIYRDLHTGNWWLHGLF